MAFQADGRIIIAGDFDEYNGFTRNGLARLNSDGTLDFSFDPGSGGDVIVRAIAVTTDGLGNEKILVGGDFFFFDDVFSPGVAQLTTAGLVDDLSSFDIGGGASGSVYALAVQANRSIVIGGSFDYFDARPRGAVARLNPNGSLDLSFDPGSGADNTVFSVAIQPDQKVLVGGPFQSFNGTRRMGLARLRLDGTVDTSFLDTGYNQFAGLINPFSFSPPNSVASIALQPDGNVMIGGSFTSVGGNPSFEADIPNHYTVFTRSDKRARYNIARLIGGVTPGPGNTEFDVENYFVD